MAVSCMIVSLSVPRIVLLSVLFLSSCFSFFVLMRLRQPALILSRFLWINTILSLYRQAGMEQEAFFDDSFVPSTAVIRGGGGGRRDDDKFLCYTRALTKYLPVICLFVGRPVGQGDSGISDYTAYGVFQNVFNINRMEWSSKTTS